jgi:hypothetical protein
MNGRTQLWKRTKGATMRNRKVDPYGILYNQHEFDPVAVIKIRKRNEDKVQRRMEFHGERTLECTYIDPRQ